MEKYHYEAMFTVKYDEIISKMYLYLHEKTPAEAVPLIKHTSLEYYTKQYNLKGFTKEYNNVYRRYLLSKEGIWYETDLSSSVSLGYEVTDITLEAFALKVKDKYYINKLKEDKK